MQGESTQAIEHYQKALEQNPQNDVSRFNLAGNLLTCYQPKKAQTQLQMLRNATLQGAERLWERSLLQQGQIEAVTSHALPAEQNRDWELCAWIGEACAAQNEVSRAEGWLARSVELQPVSAWARAELAYVRKKQNLEGLSGYGTADQTDPVWRERMRRCAWDLAGRRSPDECLPKLALLLARIVADSDESRRPEDLDTLAAALAQGGRFDEAVQYEKEAIKRAGAPEWQPMRDRLSAYQRHELWVKPSRSKEQWPNPP